MRHPVSLFTAWTSRTRWRGLLPTRPPICRSSLVGFSAGGLASLLSARDVVGLSGWIGLDPVDQRRPGNAAAPALGVPSLILRAPPSGCNADGNGARIAEALPAATSEDLVVPDASHCDFEDPTSLACVIACGPDHVDRRERIGRAVVSAALATGARGNAHDGNMDRARLPCTAAGWHACCSTCGVVMRPVRQSWCSHPRRPRAGRRLAAAGVRDRRGARAVCRARRLCDGPRTDRPWCLPTAGQRAPRRDRPRWRPAPVDSSQPSRRARDSHERHSRGHDAH